MFKTIRLVFIILILSAFTFTLQAQSELRKKGTPLSFSIYKTTNDSLSIYDVLKKDSLFKTKQYFKQKTQPKDIFWIKVDFSKEFKDLQKDSIWYLNFKTFTKASIFHKENNGFSELQFGVFSDLYKNQSILYSSGIPFKTDALIKNRFLILKVQTLTVNENIQNWKINYTSKTQNDLTTYFYTYKDLKTLIPYYVFSGICLVMFIITLSFYVYSKRKEFLFYLLYVFALFFFLEVRPLNLHKLFFNGFNLYSYIFFNTLQIVINLFYILFIMFYLETKTIYPKLHIALKIIAIILSTIIILDVLFLIFSFFEGHIFLLNSMRLIMTLFGIIGMIYLLIKSKNKISYFVVIGSFLYMFGALLTLFSNDRLYMITGSSLEILVFGIGLSYKIRQEYKEKIRFQKESLLNKTKALRAQINPHFIFNSLSSIQYLIINNDKTAALKYLSKFSHLSRSILESSFETSIILEDEIKMLHNYIDLESLRFENSFDYQINVDDTIEPKLTEIPALLAQPFVENAIIHGLLKKLGNNKKLEINYRKQDRYIICEIDDNGIGRKAASNKVSNHKSRGIEVTEKRLKILNKLDDNINFIEIVDKHDDFGNPTGTKVIIKMLIE